MPLRPPAQPRQAGARGPTLGRILAGAIMLVVAIGMPSTARASWVLPPPPDDHGITPQWMLDRYLPIARAAWPGSPCEGRERVTLNDDVEIDARVAAAPSLYPERAVGLAFGASVTDPSSPDYCRVGLRMTTDGPSLCVELTHELGHLAGHVHNRIPGDPMSEVLPNYLPCSPPEPTGRALRKLRLDQLLRWDLPRPDEWTFTCDVVHGGALRCTATAPFAKHPRIFAVRPDLNDLRQVRTTKRPGRGPGRRSD